MVKINRISVMIEGIFALHIQHGCMSTCLNIEVVSSTVTSEQRTVRLRTHVTDIRSAGTGVQLTITET